MIIISILIPVQAVRRLTEALHRWNHVLSLNLHLAVIGGSMDRMGDCYTEVG